MLERCADRDNGSRKSQVSQAEYSMVLQKSARSNFGFLNASTLQLLTSLCYRLGATLAAGAIAIPLEPIPGIDLAYDIGVPIALIWYWFTFFKDARRTMSHTPSTRAVADRQSK
jgi:hypothetical protein